MWNWLRRILSSSTHNNMLTTRAKVVESDGSQEMFSVVSKLDCLTGSDINAVYCGLILGVHSPIESRFNTTEIAVINKLNKIIGSYDSRMMMIPRLPAVIPQFMQSVRDEEVSNLRISKQLGKDPSLAADVIKMASSPYYRTDNGVRSLEDAVAVLGNEGIRKLILNAAFRPILNLQYGHYTQLASGYIWRKSEYCAFVAHCLASQEKQDSFAAYLAGLIMDIGFIVALNVIDVIGELGDAPRSKRFHKIFFQLSHKVSGLIAADWELPLAVVAAIDDQAEYHDPKSMSTLGAILYHSTLISQLQLLIEEQRIDEDISLRSCRIEGTFQDSGEYCLGELMKYVEK